VRVILRGATIADTTAAMKFVEAGREPVYFIAKTDIAVDRLAPGSIDSYSEWTGVATYWSVYTRGLLVINAAWSYEEPPPPYATIRGYVAFSARLIDECWIDDERVVVDR
jgi:uncharacterized protein (DUF427 family)